MEVNLPWRAEDLGYEAAPEPDTSAAEREYALKTYGRAFSVAEWDECRRVRVKNAYLAHGMDQEVFDSEDARYAMVDKLPEDVRALLFAERDKQNELEAWRMTLPEWVAWSAAMDQRHAAWKARSFCYQARPGMFLVLANGHGLLVGDINSKGGVCDDCTGIDNEDVIVRYCVLPDYALIRAVMDAVKVSPDASASV